MMPNRHVRLAIAALLGALGCTTQATNLANSARDDAGVSEPDGSMYTLGDAGVVFCGALACACSDGRDNDGDGLIDGFDPECTGASDNFEDSFATGLHGEDRTAKCEDCFFDANSGAGDDGCRRAASCGVDGTSSAGNGSCKTCAVGMACTDSCGPLVPNGCDCFGCCNVWQAGSATPIMLGKPLCSMKTLHDPSKCLPCVMASDCQNPCGTCELCPGRTVADLPLACAAGSGPGFVCDERRLCTTAADCGALEYCQQGCCLAIGI